MRKPEMKSLHKNRIVSAVCAACITTTSFVNAGPDSGGYGAPSGAANAEVIKRLQRIENARLAEAEGDRRYADGDYEGALEKYREAINGIPNAPLSAADRSRMISKFANAALKQADKLGKMGRFDDAKVLLKEVLADEKDPDNHSAKVLMKRLDDPDYYNPSMTKVHYEDTEQVSKLLKQGLGYFDLGQFYEAQKSFNAILEIDATNTAARRQLENTEREITNYLRSARDHTRARALREVDQLWESPVPHTTSVPVSTNPTTDKVGSPILMKLKSIMLPKINFDAASIEDVISYLHAKSIEFDNLDPNKSGINFILKTKGNAPAPITVNDMRDVPMIVALDTITQLANLSYRVESHAVVITSITESGQRMETRVFRVPPNFLSSAGSVDAGGGAAEQADPFGAPPAPGAGSAIAPRANAQTVLSSLGANFEAAGSSATFIPGSSRLVVKNTLQQLDIIERLIEELQNKSPKQVYITTKFVEISQRNTEELGFDTLLGAFNIGNRHFASGGTSGNGAASAASNYPFVDPTSGTSPTITGQNPMTAGNRSGGRAIATNAIDGLLANGIASQGAATIAPGIFALAGVFSDPQFQIVMRALSQKKGVDLLTAPSIVSRSGQRAKIEIIREFPYPTDFDPPQIPQTFGGSTLQGGGLNGGLGQTSAISSFPVTPTTPTTFAVRNTGVSMEVDPVIGEDGNTIDLTIAPEVVEFEGFINFGSPINTGGTNALGVATTVVLTENRIEQPVFATRKLNTAVTIWDGQTVGIGGLIREDVQMVEDKVPLFGDIPFIGRLFKTKAEEHFKKNLMIYVTAKLIDPSGNPIKQQSGDMREGTPPEMPDENMLFPGSSGVINPTK